MYVQTRLTSPKGCLFISGRLSCKGAMTGLGTLPDSRIAPRALVQHSVHCVRVARYQ